MSDQKIFRYQVMFNKILPVWATSGLSFQIFLTMKQKAEATLKQALIQGPALKLLNLEKAFHLYVHKKEGIDLGMLT